MLRDTEHLGQARWHSNMVLHLGINRRRAVKYLRAMADGPIFNPKADPVELIAGQDTPEDILEMALGVERDSIAFYVGLKRSVSEAAGKDRVEDIVKEEISHVAILSKELEKLK